MPDDKPVHDGGPAFPRAASLREESVYDRGAEGMTLRDYLAAHASRIIDDPSVDWFSKAYGIDPPDEYSPTDMDRLCTIIGVMPGPMLLDRSEEPMS